MNYNIVGVLMMTLCTGAAFAQTAKTAGQPNDALRKLEVAMQKQRKAGTMVTTAGATFLLRAGTLKMEFRDGQLRYIYAGDREVCRRIYFAVRDGNWNTITPVVSNVKVAVKGDDAFTINFDSHSANGDVDFEWHTTIEGKSDSTISYLTQAKANKDFKSNRIGICVLYGSETVRGLPFATEKAGGADKLNGVFPKLVSPELTFWQKQYAQLSYTSPAGTATTTATGAAFDMEDQRWFGDSSYKAYAPVPYAYPQATKDTEPRETRVLFHLNGAMGSAGNATETVTQVAIGAPTAAKLPKISFAAPDSQGNIFSELFKQADVKTAATLTWAFSPAVHLADEDVFMENISVLRQQTETARALNSTAKFVVSPISLNKLGDKPKPDTRLASGQFAAAWSLLVLKELAFAGVNEAVFAEAGTPSAGIVRELVDKAGTTLSEVRAHSPGTRALVDALAYKTPQGTVVWLINKTDRTQKVEYSAAATPTVKKTVELGPYAIIPETLK